jgi:glutamate/tyrosine decarboxylase-like PLP-dependent enzyme
MMVIYLFLCLMHTPQDTSADRVKPAHKRQERIFRPLVPQLLPNYTTPSLPPASEVTCNYASLACTYRAGCGSALKQYMAMCEDLVQGVTSMCSMDCRHALIALISTQEGERLMQVNTINNSFKGTA